MEGLIRQDNNQTLANATEIIKKFKSLQDRINFCLEKNLHHPREIGFDATFFLQVLSGRKKYLPGNFSMNYKILFFRTGEKLGKQYLINKMKGNSAYAAFRPDHIDPMKNSKSFLLNLIAFVDPPLFKSLYAIQKKQMIEKTYNMWQNYQLSIKNELINDIKNFYPINCNKGKQGGFKTVKNHQSTGVFLNSNQNQNAMVEPNIRNILGEQDEEQDENNEQLNDEDQNME